MDDEREEEQKMEIEALRSIFTDDFRDVPFDSGDRIGVVDRDENIACYEIVVSPLGIGEEDALSDAKANTLGVDPDLANARLGVVFAHTSEYPNEMPRLKCRSVRNINEKECLAVTEMVRSKARRELLGAPMMYDVVEHAKEWLRRRTRITTEHDDDDLLGEDAEEKAKKRLELEAEERLKAMRETGTPVTKETFEEWARAFDAERAMATASTMSKETLGEGSATRAKAQQGVVSMSGRRFFEERYEAFARKSGDDDDDDDDDGREDVEDAPEDDDTFSEGVEDEEEDEDESCDQ
tara:strand:+ start:120 stop:1004 length:885 start_codon:yes stop_codon:yes gene_type:complete